MKKTEIFHGQEVKLRIKNRTGGDVVIFKDGTVQFDLYCEEERTAGEDKKQEE